MSRLLIFQSCDPYDYFPLLAVTQPSAAAYARRHGHHYEAFVGIKRGIHPWHACFNRIVLLHEMVRAGLPGWALYLDADSYVVDFEFDCVAYLADKHDKAFVMAPGCRDAKPWQVNNGIFFANLENPACREISIAWLAEFERRWPDELLQRSSPAFQYPHDQDILSELLERGPPEWHDSMFIDSNSTFNYQYGRFARQAIRAHHATLAERVETARAGIAAAMEPLRLAPEPAARVVPTADIASIPTT